MKVRGGTEKMANLLSKCEIASMMKKHLEIGKYYSLKSTQNLYKYDDERGRIREEKMKCIQIYKNFAVFEKENGTTETYNYYDLFKKLKQKRKE